MSSTDTATTTTTTKERIAERTWIDTSGNEVEPEAATGCKYVDKATGKVFEYQTKNPAGEHVTMLAIFGALTKAGNIRSTLSQKDANADVMQGIEDWFDILVDQGIWSAEKVGGGIRFNSDVMAQAIANAKGETDVTPYLTKLNAKLKVKDPGDKAGKREISYAAYAYRNPKIKNEYHRLLPADTAAPDLTDL